MSLLVSEYTVAPRFFLNQNESGSDIPINQLDNNNARYNNSMLIKCKDKVGYMFDIDSWRLIKGH